MKTCPKCQQTYTDANLNFCLNDGELLLLQDNAPPTIFMDAPRTTNPNWQDQPAPNTWQTNQTPNNWQNQQMTQPNQQGFNPPAFQTVGQNQTLPIISLTLGIFSLGLFCCWIAGLPLSIAAVITGYIGMNNANNNPTEYGGKGMAIGGLVLGGIGLAISFIMIIFGLIGSIS
jgi:hypothetical protein